MKVTPALTVFFVAAAVFIFSSYIPDFLIHLLSGNMIGAAVLLGAILYTMRSDKVLAIAVFLAAAALFLESRRRTVDRVAVTMGAEKPVFQVEQLSQHAPDLVPGEKHPSRPMAEYEDHNYEPSEESGSNKFEPVDETLNEKQPLETVPPHPDEVSSFFQQKGLAAVDPA